MKQQRSSIAKVRLRDQIRALELLGRLLERSIEHRFRTRGRRMLVNDPSVGGDHAGGFSDAMVRTSSRTSEIPRRISRDVTVVSGSLV
jgi:hypothetical protein